MKRHYIATLHVLVELDDDVPGMSTCCGAACDAIAEWMREAAEFKDWGYARATTGWTTPVAVKISDDYQEGDIYDLLPGQMEEGR
jgi:hypothetical protein